MAGPQQTNWTVTNPGIVDGMPDHAYHADPVPGGSLSNTGAKILATKTGWHFDTWRKSPPTIKDEFDFGHAAHREVLGEGLDVALIAGPWTTNAAKAKVAAARERGQVPLKPEQYDTVLAMAEAIAANPLAHAVLSGGRPEQSAFWVDDRTGVWRRARLDWLPDGPTATGQFILGDYKTSTTIQHEKWAKDAANYGYHQQADSYTEAIRALGIHPNPSFVFVVQEKTAPYAVEVFQLDSEAMAIGRHLNDLALDRYVEYTAAGHWPGPPPIVNVLALPTWYARNFEGII